MLRLQSWRSSHYPKDTTPSQGQAQSSTLTPVLRISFSHRSSCLYSIEDMMTWDQTLGCAPKADKDHYFKKANGENGHQLSRVSSDMRLRMSYPWLQQKRWLTRQSSYSGGGHCEKIRLPNCWVFPMTPLCPSGSWVVQGLCMQWAAFGCMDKTQSQKEEMRRMSGKGSAPGSSNRFHRKKWSCMRRRKLKNQLQWRNLYELLQPEMQRNQSRMAKTKLSTPRPKGQESK